MKVLLIGDLRELERDISVSLEVRWPGVILIYGAEQKTGVELVQTEQPDIVLLDFDSPQLDGFSMLNEVRSFSDVPIIIVSRRDDVMDTIRALEIGADNWIPKPIVPMLLLAKVNAVLRRCGVLRFQQGWPSFISDKLAINYATREVYVSGKPVKLTPTEYNMLCRLVRNEGKVVTNSSLLDSVWGPEYATDVGFIKKYVYRLRSKLEDDQENPQMLLTERGIGYKFVRPTSSAK